MDSTEKKIAVHAILALKDALTHIYWAKNDLKRFIDLTIDNPAITSTIDWQLNTKLESVSQLVDRMAKRQDIYQGDLIKLIKEVASFEDFTHLNKWDESELKIKKAKDAVAKLRSQTQGYFESLEDSKKSEKVRSENKAKIAESLTYQKKLEELKNEFIQIAMDSNPQSRGYKLEKFLRDLFFFFDLDPKSSFKIVGEQIDGSFTFENTDYLLEAKWQKKPIDAQDLYGFSGKINGKFKNTCGLYVSLEGYSEDALKNKNPDTKALILMDGLCLMQVLEGRIKLTDMLYRKRRHASQTGEIFYRITNI